MSEIPQPGPIATASTVDAQRSFGCGTIVALLAVGGIVATFFLPRVTRTREVSRRSQCKLNLRQIALALHAYTEVHRALPPAYTLDSAGKPLHSWRTLILPYLGEAPLYNSINLAKPWDDPVNEKALKTPVPVYSCPSTPSDRTHTVYFANASQSGCFHAGASRSLSEVTDGESNTLLVFEVPAERAVPWMSPTDADEALLMELSVEQKLQHVGGVHAALCDGLVRFLFLGNLPPATRRALFTIEAGDEVGEF